MRSTCLPTTPSSSCRAERTPSSPLYRSTSQALRPTAGSARLRISTRASGRGGPRPSTQSTPESRGPLPLTQPSRLAARAEAGMRPREMQPRCSREERNLARGAPRDCHPPSSPPSPLPSLSPLSLPAPLLAAAARPPPHPSLLLPSRPAATCSRRVQESEAVAGEWLAARLAPTCA